MEINKEPGSSGCTDPVEAKSLQQRVLQLEQVLADYIERYGLTNKAREVFQDPKR